ncbi:unnamed protein product [Discosporangium mesarthrocarpum]
MLSRKSPRKAISMVVIVFMTSSFVPRHWGFVMSVGRPVVSTLGVRQPSAGGSCLGRRARGDHETVSRLLRPKTSPLRSRGVTSLNGEESPISASQAGRGTGAEPSSKDRRGTGVTGQGFATKDANTSAPKGGGKQTSQKPKVPKPPRAKNLLVVGLGNPGDKYRMTRHNAGFLVIEELCRRHGATLKPKSAFQGDYCSFHTKGKSVGILRPSTYMNNSGQAARKVLDYFKLTPSSVLVVVDEMALDFGQLRLKAKGSPGGHNGLKSIQGHLRTPEYSRIRVGIGGKGPPGDMADHVLGEFSRSEQKGLGDVLADACDAVEHWIEEDDLQKVMTRCNAPR